MDDRIDLLPDFDGFDWDEGNAEKNWVKHRVSKTECEETFFNDPLLAFADVRHSHSEARFYTLGQTDDGRRLSIIVSMRGRMIRIISARDMSRRERKEYDHAKK